MRLPLPRGKRRPALWLFVLGAALACRRVAGVVLDLPPQPAPRAAPSAPAAAAAAGPAAADTARAPIEALTDPDSVRALLPKDRSGNIDWAAALHQGVIRPRADLPGAPVSPTPRLEGFRYDFLYHGSQEALFPHSTHVEWLACESCHPRIFRYRDEPVTMADIDDGKYCGACHNKVAFPTETACERCHTAMPPQPGASPDFLGDIVFKRPPAATAAQAATFPPARFSHWVHRIRYRCSACHPRLFEPRAGADTLTMAIMRGGRGCGRCHDDRTAFGLFACSRCHR